MRLHIVLAADGPVTVPWDYLQRLHGFLYDAIRRARPRLAHFLHEQGFVVGSHRYKLLTFSRLFPTRAQGREDGLILHPPIHWWVSSPLPAPMEALAVSLLTEGVVILHPHHLLVERLEVEPIPSFDRSVALETLSPIVVSTGALKNGKLQHRFLSPEEEDFWRIVQENLKRKAIALWGRAPDPVGLKCYPVGVWKSRLYRVHKGQVRGYEGKFIAEGAQPWLMLGYEAGFGERNAQGFGMVRIAKDPRTASSAPGSERKGTKRIGADG
ncbi:MAG: CRISPR-associated endoribonuclease Cas6 [Armatimonadetes bacterium]|nr:CRISPR-associated endoribonuclease Cas6 [Armatimonadota bacterium]MDW8121933.1 CRISPR-associated endoribonuclease Cas6 [Armatimonadota bacterium]